MRRSFTIDYFVPGHPGFTDEDAVVAVDVIRATTTAISAVSQGLRCIPVANLDAAAACADQLERPLLVGELGGNMPYGFDLDNSPVQVTRLTRTEPRRPIVLLSSSGTRLMCEAAARGPAYAACFRNYSAQSMYLAANHPRVALVGAGTRGVFREEDQLCCVRIAEALMQAGYEPEAGALEFLRRWSNAPLSECLVSPSVEYLRTTGRIEDLEFILQHDDDVRAVFPLEEGEVKMLPLPGD